MTMVLNSLRGHFFKNLSCTTSSIITGRFFNGRRVHRLIPFIHLSKSCAAQRYKHWKRIQTAAKFSTLSSPSSETPASDSFTSPYLSVRICCQKDVAVSEYSQFTVFSSLLCLFYVSLRTYKLSSEQLNCYIGCSSYTIDVDKECWISSISRVPKITTLVSALWNRCELGELLHFCRSIKLCVVWVVESKTVDA